MLSHALLSMERVTIAIGNLLIVVDYVGTIDVCLYIKSIVRQ